MDFFLTAMSSVSFKLPGVMYLEDILKHLLHQLFDVEKEDFFKDAVTIMVGEKQRLHRENADCYHKIWPFNNDSTDCNAIVITAKRPPEDVCPISTGTNPYYLECCAVDAVFAFLNQRMPSLGDFKRGFSFRYDNGVDIRAEEVSDVLLKHIGNLIKDYWLNVYGFSLEIIDKLSLRKYEKAATNGQIMIVDNNDLEACLSDPAARFVKLNKPLEVQPENERLLRKLMTGAGAPKGNKTAALLFCPNETLTKAYCHGIISEKTCNSHATIEIKGPYDWQFVYNNKILFRRNANDFKAHLDTKWHQKKRLKMALKKEFGDSLSGGDVIAENICNMSAEHGASVLIVEALEAGWLKERFDSLVELNRSLSVDENLDFSADEESIDIKMLSSVASMDGAIIIALNEKVLYVATILDGKAIVPSDSARGARYSSLKNFVAECGNEEPRVKIVGVVMSEDGGQDVLYGGDPKLKCKH